MILRGEQSMMFRVGALALAAGLAAAGSAVPAAAQTSCQQIQVTTTRITNPINVTPLDAIAFPATLTPSASTVVRQAVICPSGTMFPPGFVPAPRFVGSPGVIGVPGVVGAPGIIGAPLLISPVVIPSLNDTSFAPVVTAPVTGPSTFPAAPAGGPSRSAPAARVPTDTVRDLAARSTAYDRMLVTVTGTASGVEETKDAGGRPITAFRLDADGASVQVVVWGHSGVTAGEHVRVTGPFYLASPFQGPGGRAWHNVIEAQTLER